MTSMQRWDSVFPLDIAERTQIYNRLVRPRSGFNFAGSE